MDSAAAKKRQRENAEDHPAATVKGGDDVDMADGGSEQQPRKVFKAKKRVGFE